MITRPFTNLYFTIRGMYPFDYKIGDYTLKLPPGHWLPKYQNTYSLYDRFLPVLAKYLSSNKTIIDVGANIGDTTIAVMQTCKNPIIAFEPDEVFYSYLVKNISSLPVPEQNRIKIYKEFIGTGHCVPLDHLIPDTDIVLLKVDVDGFDWDVLNSAGAILSRSEPVLFWENDITTDKQLQKFTELYGQLIKRGYRYLYIFDNFGNLMMRKTDYESLNEINNYLHTLRKTGSPLPFYYTDVLAVTERYHNQVTKAVCEYQRSVAP